MKLETRRTLLGTTGRSTFYLVVGSALFAGVLWSAYLGASGAFITEPEFIPKAPDKPRAAAASERYVPPAEVVYPFF